MRASDAILIEYLREEDSGYKLCVHTRSFNLHELSEFRVEFSIKAINYLANKLEVKSLNTFELLTFPTFQASKKSLVLFGTDMVFLRNISNNIEVGNLYRHDIDRRFSPLNFIRQQSFQI